MSSESITERAWVAHPLLDPQMPRRQPSATRFWLSTWKDFLRHPESRAEVLRSFVTPTVGKPQAPHQPIEAYLHEADDYLDDLLGFAPDALAERLRPLPATRAMNDLTGLLEATFTWRDSRASYEARRKLTLARLLFDIDHTRGVRDGPRHHAAFEETLQRVLWCDLESERETEVSFKLEHQPGGTEVKRAFEGDSDRWSFQLRSLKPFRGEERIEVYDYRSRFKREGGREERHLEGGRSRLAEASRWRHTSGSILSKMIRQGIGDAHLVQDLLGAMFLVKDRRQAYALERRLVAMLGGPFRFRDRVDTLAVSGDQAKLNSASAGFHALKQIVDLLFEDPTAASPYQVPVELQIHVLDSYVKSLSDSNVANHRSYKRRQFLNDLLPVLFPVEVMGEHRELM